MQFLPEKVLAVFLRNLSLEVDAHDLAGIRESDEDVSHLLCQFLHVLISRSLTGFGNLAVNPQQHRVNVAWGPVEPVINCVLCYRFLPFLDGFQELPHSYLRELRVFGICAFLESFTLRSNCVWCNSFFSPCFITNALH